ncbi:unnamed protein product [Bursaphelenchus okinawaensis]|uniref:Acid phosphatase n=1 Tax=Bursaphelenchus okinawaensis TaxID=465554 RepID=A0A811L0H5_9BILA|nr:unnamed protein product [Bursaphelenchus okinawaensis]CAG9115460.1 unnamed protein product [Bursaphelenchus okinawaensis]
MMFSIFIGFFFTLTINGLPLKDQLGPVQPAGHKLEYLAALWRHGDRAPAKSFYHDLVNASYWDNGYAQLTNYGIEQQRRLGKWIYNRYVQEFKYLPTDFDSKSIKIQSTWYNRTKESALYNFKGLYGEDISFGKLKILTIPDDQVDIVGLPYDNCEYAHQLAKEILKTKEVKEYLVQHKQWQQRLAKAMNMSMDNVVDWFSIEDPLYLEKRKGLKLSPEYETNYAEIFDMYLQGIRFMYGLDLKPQNLIDWRYEMVKMQAGGLLTTVVNDMSVRAFCEHNPNQAYWFFSMHDTNVLGVLNSFDFPKVDYNRNDNVELGCSLFFELWSDEEKQKYVKIIYRRSPEEIFDLSEQISGCKSIGKGLGCSLEDFLKRTDKYLIPRTDKYCAKPLPSESSTDDAPLVPFKV